MTSPKRPMGVTILVLGVLTSAVLFWARFYQAVTYPDFIMSRSPSVSPAYLALTGLLFGLAGLPTAWGLWSGRSWAPAAARRLAVALAVYYWLDFAFLVVSETSRGSWPFAAIMTIFGVGFVFWVLARPGSRAFFKT